MSCRSPKELIKAKWGSKPSNSKSETALEKFRGEIAALKTSADEITIGKGKLTDKERHRLLEKIRVLEAEREKKDHHLTEKDKEIQRLRDQMKVKCSTTALLEQLEEKTKEGERREQLLKSLSEESDVLKNQLFASTTRIAELENNASTLLVKQTMATSCFNSSMSNINEMELKLKDALEKNQQWLVYDQQREVYVKGLLARISELEQKSETVAHSLPQQTKKTESEGFLQEEKQKYYSHVLAKTKKDLEVERQTNTQLNSELSEFRRKYEESQKEVQDLNQLLCLQRKAHVQHLEDDRHKTEKIQRLKEENDIAREKLEEEKKRSEELLSQVQSLYTALLKQQEEQTRVALLEQQMQACALDFENEKLDRQNMQHQLHVIIKELRKTRNQITQLEPSKQLREFAFTEPLVTFQRENENRVKIASPKSPAAALNESLVECPKCNIQYPATEHRDLLVHVEYCSK
ncbi:centrosomal protein of 55 kDa [Talpa occidentalis]|uniref:centrosomal protein of 55 kDa n=1 Tax=Talpa occidentalis TaxID=50954 RepID=UPI0018908918|nr:centrosomal protein of 55 kDa [Talpa occidentalis]XP_037352482.1 centrosomal protein of 55 kDa [Talpa occidentalis]XP_037352483.1 centrosomal protein of 55 kDa [Talpa occidentalis]